MAFKHQVSLLRRCFHFSSFSRLGDRLAVEQEKGGGGGGAGKADLDKYEHIIRALTRAGECMLDR